LGTIGEHNRALLGNADYVVGIDQTQRVESGRSNASCVRNTVVNVDVASRRVTGEAGRAVSARVNLEIVANDSTIARGIKTVTDRSRRVQPRVVDIDHSVSSVGVELSSSVVHGDIDVVEVGSGGIGLEKEMIIMSTGVEFQKYLNSVLTTLIAALNPQKLAVFRLVEYPLFLKSMYEPLNSAPFATSKILVSFAVADHVTWSTLALELEPSYLWVASTVHL
jgi:hypothetical protein